MNVFVIGFVAGCSSNAGRSEPAKGKETVSMNSGEQPGVIEARASAATEVPESAPELAVAWHIPGNEWPEVVAGQAGLYVVEQGALVRRDARTGAVTWRSSPPAGVHWFGARAGQDVVAVTGGSGTAAQPQRHEVGVVDAGQGTLRWHRSFEEPVELMVGAGDGLALRYKDNCVTEIVNPRTGVTMSPRFAGNRYERRSLGGKGWSSECRPSTEVLGRFGDVTVVSTRQRDGYRISAWSERGAGDAAAKEPMRVWEFDWPGAGWPVFWPEQNVIAMASSSGLYARGIDTATGASRWSLDLIRPEGCDGDAHASIRPAPGPDSRAGVLAVQCGHAQLHDAKSGALLWRRDTADVPVIAGEMSVYGRQVPVTGYAAAIVQWLSPAGEPGVRMRLEAGLREVYAFGDRLLVVAEQHVYARDRDGGESWRYAIDYSNSLAAAPRWFVVQDRGEPRNQVVIEVATGRVAGVVRASYAVGVVPGTTELSELLIVRRADDSGLAAVVLPREATP